MGISETRHGLELIDLAIYMDGSATKGTANDGEGIMFTAGKPSNSTFHHSCAISASIWCSSFHAEMKAIKWHCRLSRQKSNTESTKSQRQPIRPFPYRKPPTCNTS